MNLRARLERLRAAQQAQADRSSAVHSDSAERLLVAGNASSAAAEEAQPGAQYNESIAALRRELRRALGSSDLGSSCDRPGTESPSASVPAATMSLSQLPFDVVSTPWGPLRQRSVQFPSHHRMGDQPLGAAAHAAGEALSSLALDETLQAVASHQWLYFDTETTGLGGSGTLAFLIGLATLQLDGAVHVVQLLVDEPESEPAVLHRVSQYFEAAAGLVSFNGKAFDGPLLATRLVMNGLPPLAARPHLDLLHVSRRLHQPRLERCNLTRLERDVLDFDRGPDVAGAEIAPLYGRYLQTGDAGPLWSVVKHNAWDVLSMVALVAKYGAVLGVGRGPSLDTWHPRDLPPLARVLSRAGRAQRAVEVADEACRRLDSPEARSVRARLAKQRGDRRAATDDFEAAVQMRADPSTHLELAKLYEHYWKLPDRALDWLDRGVAEADAKQEHRRTRLQRKICRQGESG